MTREEELLAKLRGSGEPPRGNGHSTEELPRGPRPVIIVRPGERHLAAYQGLSALATAKTPFYRRFTELVQVVRIEGKDAHGARVFSPGVMPVDLPSMQEALGAAAIWQKPKGKGLVIIDPPDPVARMILSLIERWPFPVLRGVIATQTLRFDGSVLDKAGYDAATGLYLADPPAMPALPENPGWREAEQALTLLNGLLDQFPFAKDEGISNSAAISMLMTTVLRGMMGVAPMHAITKPQAGTGGSYLTDLAAMIATGERCPVITPTEDRDENEKRLVAAALAGQPLISLDNVSSTVEGDFLCQLVERPRPQVRRLGTSNMFTLDNTWTTFANGNQLQVAGDMVRRTIAIELDANQENPDERKFSRDPLAEIEADRGAYIAAVLTIARAYALAGRPGRLTPKPSFEEWSDNVRSPLVWLKWKDPNGTSAKLRAEDPNRQARALVFQAWAKCLTIGTGYQTRDLVSHAADTEKQDLFDAFAQVAPGKNSPISAHALGKWLSRNINTVANETKLIVDRADAARPKWKLVLG